MQAEIFAYSLTPSCSPQGILLRVNYLREWRKHAGLTGDELGARLDPPASAGTISSYETGKRQIGPTRLAQMAEVLGTTPGKLLDEPPPAEGAKVVVPIPADIVDFWAHKSDRLKRQALAMIRALGETEDDEDTAQR
jgi:transcriptional regulator with XRE-family HTH domain